MAKITAYLDLFDNRSKKLVKDAKALRKQLKEKGIKDMTHVKKLLEDARKLRDTVKEARKDL